MAYIVKDDLGSNKKTQTALIQMEKDIQEGKDIDNELNRAWSKVLMDAVIGCPKDTGSLVSTIRIVKTPLGAMTGNVSPVKSLTIFDRTIVAGDLMMINPKTHGPVDYASYVHDGYMKNGLIYSGRPFLTNALAKNDVELMKAVDRALRKIGLKNSDNGSV